LADAPLHRCPCHGAASALLEKIALNAFLHIFVIVVVVAVGMSDMSQGRWGPSVISKVRGDIAAMFPFEVIYTSKGI
jgi:hypothetical protein